MTLKISISGVRGLVPESLTPEVCLNFAKAFGTYLNGGKVVVGTDSRASSEFIKGIIFPALLSCGCRVTDLGVCPTPTVGIMVRELKADGGMVVTASHNPLPWNGLKFMREDGIFLNEKQMADLLEIYKNQEFKTDLDGKISSNSSALATHIQKILKVVSAFSIRRRRLKVVVDACNGAGSVISVKLLQKLGSKIIELNCNPKLPFPHPPEPTPANLTELSKVVLKEKADIGFGMDSDADRLAIVTDQGAAISEEYTLALAAKFILARNKSRTPHFLESAGKVREDAKKKIIVTNLSTTAAIEDIAKSFGGTVIRTKVGEVYVAEELKNLRGLMGGEGNGGVIYPRVGFNRDALTAMAIILNYLSLSKKKISELVEELPKYYMLKKTIRGIDSEDFIEKIKASFPTETKILNDGIKILFDGQWVHIRPSNTEPLIRLMAEGKTKTAAQELIEKVEGLGLSLSKA